MEILALAIANIGIVLTMVAISSELDVLNKRINQCEKKHRELVVRVEEKQFKTRLKKECNSGNCYTNRLK